MCVIEYEGEHSPKHRQKIHAVFPVQLEQHFRIRAGAAGEIFVLDQLPEVVDFPVEDDHGGTGVIPHRLIAVRSRVQNRQSRMSQRHAVSDMDVLSVGTAMPESRSHSLNATPVLADECRDAAHTHGQYRALRIERIAEEISVGCTLRWFQLSDGSERSLPARV